MPYIEDSCAAVREFCFDDDEDVCTAAIRCLLNIVMVGASAFGFPFRAPSNQVPPPASQLPPVDMSLLPANMAAVTWQDIPVGEAARANFRSYIAQAVETNPDEIPQCLARLIHRYYVVSTHLMEVDSLGESVRV